VLLINSVRPAPAISSNNFPIAGAFKERQLAKIYGAVDHKTIPYKDLEQGTFFLFAEEFESSNFSYFYVKFTLDNGNYCYMNNGQTKTRDENDLCVVVPFSVVHNNLIKEKALGTAIKDV
jgi:hypothetical protein